MVRIEPFVVKRKVSKFTCGHDTLDNYLHKLALISSRAGYGKTYLALDESDKVLGYYSVSTAHVEIEHMPDTEFGMPGEVPVVRLGRLAVHSDLQGQGLGTMLLLHAFKQTLAVADLVGVRLLEVHTITNRAKAFYTKYDFQSFLDDDEHMYLSIDAVRRLASEAEAE